MSRIYAFILDGVAATLMIRGYQSLETLYPFILKQYGGHFQYLTNQGLAMTCLCMILGVANSLFPQIVALNFVKRSLTMVAMPVSVVISVIYWSLIIFLPKLIIPDFSAVSSEVTPEMLRLPLVVDLSIHAVPAISIILDFFLFERKYNRKEVIVFAPMAAIAFASWYAIWAEHCAKMNNGIFPYPFLTESNFTIRIGIYAGATIMAFAFFRLINNLHH